MTRIYSTITKESLLALRQYWLLLLGYSLAQQQDETNRTQKFRQGP